MNNISPPGVLVLADGSIFEGISVGVNGFVCGEVVFNTAQSGYQEILTDPSYADQIIVFTQPHIGNVGVNSNDMESDQIYAQGLIMRSFSHHTSNWRAQETLKHYLQKQNKVAVSEIDTRALTQHLRKFGSQAGCLMAGKIDIQKAVIYAKNFAGIVGKDLAKKVTTQKAYSWFEGSWQQKKKVKLPYHVVVYDFGVKRSILRCLVDKGCVVTVVPATTKAKTVLALNPDGIVLSNGPGDPAACTYAIDTIKELLEHRLPIMGICFGHQLLALASGAVTKKMMFGHHGANHPVRSIKTGAVAISSQNHGFVVADENLPSCLRVTHRSLFDGSIAGIERIDAPAFGFQGHPEANPGPSELTQLFDQFVSLFEISHAKAS